MPDNSLWEGHRIFLPELREKVLKRCRDCRFFVKIRGREEERWGCVAGVPGYGTLRVRVPETVPAVEILKKAGKDGLFGALSRGDPEAGACGLYRGRQENWKAKENVFHK